MGDRRYPEIALEAITRMVRACGFLSPWDPAGRHTAGSGVMVRHLVLPGHVQNSLDVLTSLHDRFGPDVPLSVMSQFRPTPRCQQHAQLVRPVTHQEYERVCCHVEQLGFEQVFIQPGAGDESFMPDFSEDEPFRGNTGLEDAD